jgi:plastocyanin
LRLALSLLSLAMASQVVAGTVVGTVKLVERHGRVAKDLSTVVVYVDGLKVETPPRTVAVAMKDKAFEPRLVVVPVGSQVRFPNQDPIYHNVFSVSGDNRFDLGLYKESEGKSQAFERPGVVKVYCNIHPQMSAIVVVRDNPFFALATRDGHFRLEGVPAGTRQITAWNEKARETQTVEVTVPEQGEVAVSLELDGSRYKRSKHKNKYGKDYSDKY